MLFDCLCGLFEKPDVEGVKVDSPVRSEQIEYLFSSSKLLHLESHAVAYSRKEHGLVLGAKALVLVEIEEDGEGFLEVVGLEQLLGLVDECALHLGVCANLLEDDGLVEEVLQTVWLRDPLERVGDLAAIDQEHRRHALHIQSIGYLRQLVDVDLDQLEPAVVVNCYLL